MPPTINIRDLAIQYLDAAATDWKAADVAYDVLEQAALDATRHIEWFDTSAKAREIAKLFDYQGKDIPLMVAALTPVIDGDDRAACYALVEALETAADAA